MSTTYTPVGYISNYVSRLCVWSTRLYIISTVDACYHLAMGLVGACFEIPFQLGNMAN
jgi:hypothetical protein